MAQKEKLQPVEELQKKLRIPPDVHRGTCIRQGWSWGKKVTEREYAAAAEEFKRAAGRSRHA